jgi:Protein of unknown function (DUF2797).
MTFSGMVSKMATELNTPIHYHLRLGDDRIDMNQLLGAQVSIAWKNEIRCLNCGKVTQKSFGQGYCYPCFISIPETEECVLNPELCRAHEGVARDMDWAREHCLQDHFVYLALSSEVKVGVTRQSQIPTRWIDQGASRATKLAKTPNRHLAGLIEVELKKHLTDKTNWRSMLMNKIANHVSLAEEKKRVSLLISKELQQYISEDDTVYDLQYPFLSVPQKVTSINLEKQPLQGKLNGIKGQYLIFDQGNVINVRKYGGYIIELNY